MTFKLQHPQTLISRMFILEYMKELTPTLLYSKANEYQKNKFFYKFYDDENSEQVDMNWEHLLFHASMTELENFMKEFLQELLEIDAKMKITLEKMKAEAIVEQSREPVDINIMDIAQAEINRSKGKIIGQ